MSYSINFIAKIVMQKLSTISLLFLFVSMLYT